MSSKLFVVKLIIKRRLYSNIFLLFLFSVTMLLGNMIATETLQESVAISCYSDFKKDECALIYAKGKNAEELAAVDGVCEVFAYTAALQKVDGKDCRVLYFSRDYLSKLNYNTASGKWFNNSDAKTACVVSAGLCRKGNVLSVNGEQAEVIGVLGEGESYPSIALFSHGSESLQGLFDDDYELPVIIVGIETSKIAKPQYFIVETEGSIYNIPYFAEENLGEKAIRIYDGEKAIRIADMIDYSKESYKTTILLLMPVLVLVACLSVLAAFLVAKTMIEQCSDLLVMGYLSGENQQALIGYALLYAGSIILPSIVIGLLFSIAMNNVTLGLAQWLLVVGIDALFAGLVTAVFAGGMFLYMRKEPENLVKSL